MTKSVNKVFADIDGLLANFIEGACKAHNKQNPYLNPENHGKTDLQELLGLETVEFWRPYESDFWENLEVMSGAKNLINFLENNFENVYLLGSTSKNYGCIPGKLKWIKKHFPQFERRNLLGAVKECCAGNNSLLIDDFHKNTEKFEEHGGLSCLIPRKWNRLHDLDHNVEDDWKYVANWLFERGILQ